MPPKRKAVTPIPIQQEIESGNESEVSIQSEMSTKQRRMDIHLKAFEQLFQLLKKIIPKISSTFLRQSVVENLFLDLHQSVMTLKIEYEVMLEDSSPEEQSAWWIAEKDELLSIMEPIEVTTLINYRKCLMELYSRQIAASNALSVSTIMPRGATTSMQSMIAPLAMGLADVSMASYFSEKQQREINSDANQKNSSEMQSTITLKNGDVCSITKSDIVHTDPEYLLTMSLLNVRDVTARRIPRADWWKFPKVQTKYYGIPLAAETPRAQTILAYVKVLETLITEDIKGTKPKPTEQI